MRKGIAAAALILVLLALAYFALQRGAREPKREFTAVNQVLGGAPAHGFERALAPRTFRFPQDHGPHHGFRNEWWYFTGNLQSDDGRSFGYQLTLFRVALTPHPVQRESHWGTNEIYLAHFAVTDVGAGEFHFAERFSRAALGLAGAGGTPLQVRLEDWSAVEVSGEPWGVRLVSAAPEMALDLHLAALKPVVLNGEGGLSRKSGTPGNASYYYSIPRLRTTGVLRSGTKRFRVSGLSWLDREWSTSALESDQVGWDWFALHLADGRDLMFYRMRRRDGSSDPFSGGTLIAADGAATAVPSRAVTLEVRRWWTSTATGARYPSEWRLRLPSQAIDLLVLPRLPDQELVTSFRYWEGAVTLRSPGGEPAGEGYLEMTGY